MKEYAEIYIDPEESLKSFLEKLQSVTLEPIVVIVHQRSSIFRGQVNIELINKYAQRADKKLIFISNLAKVKNLLTGVGFKVYNDLEEFKAQQGISEEKNNLMVETKGKKLKLKSKGSILKRTVVVAIIFLLLSGAGYFYFTSAVVTIKVTPTVKTEQVVSTLKADLQQEGVDFDSQTLPLRKKKIKLKTVTKEEASGQKSVGVEYAEGVVTFVNNTKQQVVIPAGTIIATRNGIKYKTLAKAKVPPLKVDKMMEVVVGAQAGKEEVNIRALHKGKSANVSKGRIVEFANKSYSVKLFNPEAATGGKNKSLKQITAADIERGLTRAKQELRQAAEQELEEKFGSEMIFFKEQVQLKEQQLKPQKKKGDLAPELAIKGQTMAAGVAVKKKELKDLVFEAYNQQLGTKFSLYSDKIKIKDIKISQKQEQQLELQVISTGQVIGNLRQVELIDKILGKKVANVKSLLDNMNEVSNYKISPKNQVNLPQFKYGLKLIVVEPVKE